jgi:hypothetical protein|tara:strand:- start:2494 stop:2691 length:198 start_codon:yes stop_codon:yes gene_type:complete
MSETTKAALDKVLSKVTSRKLLVWLTATGLVLSGSLTSEDWVAVALVYIGSQSAVDLARAWRHGE